MPNYDYFCLECDHTFEVFQKISEPLLKNCPACSKAALERGIGGSSATFRFHGSGFYITDYPKGSCSKNECECPKNKLEKS